MKKQLFSVFCFLLLNSIQLSSFAQKRVIDSLQLIVKSTSQDSTRIHSLNRLSAEYLDLSNYPDAYATAQRALYLAQKSKIKKEIAKAYWNIANVYCYQEDYTRSLDYYFKCLKVKEEIGKEFPEDYKKQEDIAKSYNEIGYIYDYLSNYPRALEYYFKCLKQSEKIGYKEGMAISYTNAAGVFDYQKNYDKAFEYAFKAAELDKELGRKGGLGLVYNNIGNLYFKNKNYAQSLNYQLKSLKIKSELGDELQIAQSLNNIGNIYEGISDLSKDTIEKLLPAFKDLSSEKIKSNLLDSADLYFKRSIAISEKEKSDYGIMLGYIGLGSVYHGRNKLKEALDYYDQAAAIGVKLKTQRELYETYGTMADISSKLGKYEEAFRNQKMYSDLKDTVFNETKEKDLGGQEARFEYDKELLSKQKEQEKKDAVNAEEKRRQKLIAASASGGLILMIIFAIFILKSYRQKQKANIEITRQKEIIEVRNKEVHDSITYAKRIQSAILPPDKLLKEYLPDSFVLFKPKDIVSGDFYWLETVQFENLKMRQFENEKKEKNSLGNSNNFSNGQLIFLAAADCTGHGVPGAMVSVVGHNELNRCIKEFGLTQPAEILNKLTQLVEETFSKSEDEVKDGMDISLCSIKFLEDGKVSCEWAGANNPIWIIRNGSLKEMKPDKQPIGKFDARKPFTNHVLELEKGDTIYIFTDGFADQFGGPKGKKFKYKQLEKLILGSQSENMESQKIALDKAFEEWRGDLEQIDDVCIIGFRI